MSETEALRAEAVPAALAAPAFSNTAAVKLHYTCTPAHRTATDAPAYPPAAARPAWHGFR